MKSLMKTALIILIFVAVTMGPLLALWLRSVVAKRRNSASKKAGK